MPEKNRKESISLEEVFNKLALLFCKEEVSQKTPFREGLASLINQNWAVLDKHGLNPAQLQKGLLEFHKMKCLSRLEKIVEVMETALYQGRLSNQFIIEYRKVIEDLGEEPSFFLEKEGQKINLTSRAYHLAALHDLRISQYLLKNCSAEELVQDGKIRWFKEIPAKIEVYDKISGINHQELTERLQKRYEEAIKEAIPLVKPVVVKKQKRLFQAIERQGEIAFFDNLTIWTIYRENGSEEKIAYPCILLDKKERETLEKRFKKTIAGYFQFSSDYSQLLGTNPQSIRCQYETLINGRICDYRSKNEPLQA